ncbi:glycosyltransferase family 2 protein [bacterium]|nr:glycosyltransferase family 2 protein [bacterium]
MTKLIIQIPAYNEEETLGLTLSELPKSIDGIDEIEVLVIDDGSTDNTVEVAKQYGANHIISLGRNCGLAKTFVTGIRAALKLGADIIVNTDADNQYKASNIADLVKPIIDRKADIVIGTRPISQIKHFSLVKKLLQKLGSWVVRLFSFTDVEDAPSGFRAMSANAAREINIYDNFTYTLEMIIQSKVKGLSILSVPIEVNGELRPSRLFKNTLQYTIRSMFTIVRMFIVYRPFRFFTILAAILGGIGFLLGIRFLCFYFWGHGSGHVQSLILSSIFLIIGFQTFLLAIIADLLAINRRILEDMKNK